MTKMRNIGMGKGRAPAFEKHGLRKGSWTETEDIKLVTYILRHGHGNWRALPKHAGLLRCGKSCRLRWMNYLRPDIKRGNFSKEEEDTIIRLHHRLGNKWSIIASRLPGRTDNEIKNVWNTHLKKRLISLSPSSDSSVTCNPTNNIESDITVDEINNHLEMEGDGILDVDAIPDVDGMDAFKFPSEIMGDDVDRRSRWANINMVEDSNHFDQGNNNKNFAPIQQQYNSSELIEDKSNVWWIQYLERELDLVD